MKLSEEFSNCFTEEALQRFTPYFDSFMQQFDHVIKEVDNKLSVENELLEYFQNYLHFVKKIDYGFERY